MAWLLFVSACAGDVYLIDVFPEDDLREPEGPGVTQETDAGSPGASQPRPEQPAVPAEFRDLVNPYADDTAAAMDGMTRYNASCAPCHGVVGLGDGPGGRDLSP
jgi:mono/diheme cytochrome c family protein